MQNSFRPFLLFLAFVSPTTAATLAVALTQLCRRHEHMTGQNTRSRKLAALTSAATETITELLLAVSPVTWNAKSTRLAKFAHRSPNTPHLRIAAFPAAESFTVVQSKEIPSQYFDAFAASNRSFPQFCIVETTILQLPIVSNLI